MQVTVSNEAGTSSANASALISRYWMRGVCASSACKRATRNALVARVDSHISAFAGHGIGKNAAAAANIKNPLPSRATVG